jgi:hypothetical protein
MNRTKLLFATLFLIAFTFKGVSQNSKRPEGKTVKTVYYYQFEGAKSLEEINALSTEVTAVKGVAEFKPVFKPENNFAQIIVVVTEKTRTSESDILFEITDLKKILEKKGYKNLDYTSEELSAQ